MKIQCAVKNTEGHKPQRRYSNDKIMIDLSLDIGNRRYVQIPIIVRHAGGGRYEISICDKIYGVGGG